MAVPKDLCCRYCNTGSAKTDLYIVLRNGKVQGFCLPCYERELDDKRSQPLEVTESRRG